MSLRRAINEKCKSCIYDPLAGGTWLKQVELCTVKQCPLYPVRPKPRKGSNEHYGQALGSNVDCGHVADSKRLI